jgi:hypothetical protein
MEEAPGVVFVVMRDVKVGGAYRGLRKAGVERQWELARVERRHGPGRGRNRRRSALQVWPLVMSVVVVVVTIIIMLVVHGR